MLLRFVNRALHNRKAGVVCAFSFGTGLSNKDMARLAINYALANQIQIVAQWEIAEEIIALGYSHLILYSVALTEGESYMDTVEVWKKMQPVIEGKLVCLIANEIHLIRTALLVVGFSKLAHGITSSVYDAESNQLDTRSRKAFWLHEVKLLFNKKAISYLIARSDGSPS